MRPSTASTLAWLLILALSPLSQAVAGPSVETKVSGASGVALPAGPADLPSLPATPAGLAPATISSPGEAASVEAPAAEASATPAARAAAASARAGIRASLEAKGASERRVAAESAEAQLQGAALPASRAEASFDGSGAFAKALIATPATQPRLKRGVRLDARPRPPKKGAIRLDRFHLSRDHVSDDGSKPVELKADPSDPASIEQAIRSLVDSNPRKYGAASADMAKVHVKLVKGDKTQSQADTYYAVFRQWKTGQDYDGSDYHLLVDGGALTFVIKVFDGKPTIMATEGRLYPGIDASVMKPGYSDRQLDQIAADRLQSPPDSMGLRLRRWVARRLGLGSADDEDGGAQGQPQAPKLLTRQIANVQGRWRALNIYEAADLEGRPLIVAVDVRSGDAFAWSAQSLLRSESGSLRAVAGTALGRGTSLTETGDDHGPVKALPLPFAHVYDQSGKVIATTDANGSFTVPAGGEGPVKLTIRLEGRYTPEVVDVHASRNGKLALTVEAMPGETVTPTLNATGDSEERASVINSYVYYSQQVAWLMGPGGIDDERVQSPLGGGIRANANDMAGNAYYNPANDSLNLMAAAKVRTRSGQVLQFENTAQPSIIFHESTHRAVQILSQLTMTGREAASRAFRFVAHIVEPVMDGGVNEATADTVSMYMRKSATIGNGFLIDPPAGAPELIRTGENTTRFDPQNPDPHAQGEAFMGFTWKIHAGLRRTLGEEAGAAYAALLSVPTALYSQPKDVPTAILHVVLASMTNDGKIPYLELFRQVAAIHGVDIPDVNSSAVVASSAAGSATSGRAAR